jgi:putative tryptophan/tyrosine transport system substrate-binding protein
MGLGALTLASSRVLAQTRASIGWLTVAPHPGIQGFLDGMRELGWIEGALTIEYAYANGRPERLLELARAVAAGPVQVIVASGSDAVLAARSIIAMKPVVGVSSGTAMMKPPGNFTGIALLFDETAAKWVEALAELVPPSSRLGVIHDSSASNQEQYATVRQTARALRHEAVPFGIESADGLPHAIAAARQEGLSGLIFASSPIFTARAAQVAELVRASGLPAIFESRWIVEKGGLMAYGPDFHAVFRRAASLTDRLLRGARPADLPIEHPTKFHFSLNRATARALGIELPTSLLLRADEVIE